MVLLHPAQGHTSLLMAASPSGCSSELCPGLDVCHVHMTLRKDVCMSSWNPLSRVVVDNILCMFGYKAFHSLSLDSPCEKESYFQRFKLVMPVKKQLHSKTHIKIMTVIYLFEAFCSFVQIYQRFFPKWHLSVNPLHLLEYQVIRMPSMMNH